MPNTTTDHAFILALRISLLDIEPEIWRRFLVPYDITLIRFHDVIQTVMGWHDAHLFEFHTERGCFTHVHPGLSDDRRSVRSARSAVLKDVTGPETRRFEYVYDLGDDWVHEIILEEVLSNDMQEPVLRCVGGANQCPPEDIGGPGGYEAYLEAIADPSREEYDYFIDVYGDEFEPTYFDIDGVNQRLQKIQRKIARSRSNAKRRSS